MNASAIRRAAIVVSAMQPDIRVELLARLVPSMRATLLDCISEVERRKWNDRTFALRVMDASDGRKRIAPATDGQPDIMLLADQFDVVELARVLQSRGMTNADFAVEILPAQLQRLVREELAQLDPMPPALSAATSAAALKLLGERRGGE